MKTDSRADQHDTTTDELTTDDLTTEATAADTTAGEAVGSNDQNLWMTLGEGALKVGAPSRG